MRYWDSSALAALLLQQRFTARLQALYDADPVLATWVLSDVEFRSAIARLERERAVSREVAGKATREFDGILSGSLLISAVNPVVLRAKRLLSRHPLRAADALQLAAALVAADDNPDNWEFVSLDARLNEAARGEGFQVPF